MSVSVPAAELSRDFARWREKALAGEPVQVTETGAEPVFLVSANLFHALKQARRDALLVEELSEAELAAIEAAEIPEGERYRSSDPG